MADCCQGCNCCRWIARKIIEQALRQFNNSLSDEVYESLVWCVIAMQHRKLIMDDYLFITVKL